MKVGVVRELDESKRLTASSYLSLSEDGLVAHELEVQVVVRAKQPTTGKQINGSERLKIKFNPQQVGEIIKAGNFKSVDEVREYVARLVKDNVVAALTEATRTK